MFKNVEARFALRACLAGVAAAVSALTIAVGGGITGEEALEAGLGGISVALAYAGIGVAVPVVEPSIGLKMNRKDKS